MVDRLTPEQEEFLSRLYALCKEYQSHGVIVSSGGAIVRSDARYALVVRIYKPATVAE